MDTHVLDQPRPNVFRLVRHVVIPVANNSAGMSYRTALVNSGLATVSVMKAGDGTLGTISAAEVTALASGSLFEVVEEAQLPSNLTSAQQNAYLDETYATVSTNTINALQARLVYFGATRDTAGIGQ